MMVVVGISMVQRYLPWDEAEVNEATLVPPTDLPPLDLGSQEDFDQTLDRLQTEGGPPMIQRWVESARAGPHPDHCRSHPLPARLPAGPDRPRNPAL